MRKQWNCMDKDIIQGTMPGACKARKTMNGLNRQHQDVDRLAVEESIRMTEINEESMSMVWAILRLRTSEEQNTTLK